MAHGCFCNGKETVPILSIIYLNNTFRALLQAPPGVKAILIVAWLAFLLSSAQAQGQNPTPADCGLPVSGNIIASATYTLSADCVQTGELNVATAPAGQQTGYTLTINGAGHTIKLGAGDFAFIKDTDHLNRNEVILSNFTLDGQLNERVLIMQGHAIRAENVTFTRNSGTVISATSVTLTNVLFDSNLFSGVGFGVNGGTLNITPNSSATISNAVFRNNSNMNIVLHPGATLTSEGCLSFSGNLAYNVVHSDVWASAGSWTDNSTGECSGEIGNGGQAVLPAIQLMPCGLPAGLALINSDVTYSLRGDCEGVIALVVSGGKRATIRANGYRISRDESLPAAFRIAGDASLTVSDAIFDSGQFLNFGTLTVTRSEVRNSARLALINYGTASFSNMLFEDNSAPSFAGLYYGGAIFEKGIGTFSDSKFVGVSGGDAALRATGSTAALTLNGCISFEGLAEGYPETVAQGGATLNDNRDTGACNPRVGPRPPVTPDDREDERENERKPVETVTNLTPDRCMNIGVIGLLCREKDDGEPIMEVWEITAESVVVFGLGMRQSQVEGSSQDLVMCSANGRARVIVSRQPPPEVLEIWRRDARYVEALKVPRRYITVSMGPTVEGKIHHVIIDHSIDGRVMSTVDSYSGLSGCDREQQVDQEDTDSAERESRAVYAPFVQRQAAQPDGSIVHVVQPGDTVNAIAIAYRVSARDIIARNQLGERGSYIVVGQTLVIRD